MIDDILGFWFEGGPDGFRREWFVRDDAFDAAIRTQFGAVAEQASDGAHDAWAATPEGALALLLALDQFPRNLHRGTPRAFASDGRALAVARDAVLRRQLDLGLRPTQRIFLYLPFEHAEALAEQDVSVTLFEGLRDHAPHNAPGGAVEYAWKHREVIVRFGRFPHRNGVLGRASTPAELAYLSRPGAGF